MRRRSSGKPDHNLIQAPEKLRRLHSAFGIRQAHIAPSLNEGIQPVVIFDDVREEEQFSLIGGVIDMAATAGVVGSARLTNPSTSGRLFILRKVIAGVTSVSSVLYVIPRLGTTTAFANGNGVGYWNVPPERVTNVLAYQYDIPAALTYEATLAAPPALAAIFGARLPVNNSGEVPIEDVRIWPGNSLDFYLDTVNIRFVLGVSWEERYLEPNQPPLR